ncbi:hypothetical protein KIN20_006315 [Parelaphostrongylus tenuis]|uniref:Lipoprotein n=1 Tax=Parelaphostrongylus tenuis TaxID=148309 RepID=A0AAD5QI79_PARTN|nr:hypothetical protein KIN20_006315 [Parelaphostrongylus tenuis]
MNILTKMTRLPIYFLMISLLATTSSVTGCGVMPAGQASNRTFTVSGFTTLPVAMVYSSAPTIQARFPGIAPNEAAARGFVQLLVMQTIFDVLERQARSALLPDAVISAILGQVSVQINYTPMNCELSVTPDEQLVAMNENKDNCIIVGNIVTGICNAPQGRNMCTMMANIKAIPQQHLSISGAFSTTNIVMANWSRMMWQSVVDRAMRMLASAPFGSPFIAALATVGGN